MPCKLEGKWWGGEEEEEEEERGLHLVHFFHTMPLQKSLLKMGFHFLSHLAAIQLLTLLTLLKKLVSDAQILVSKTGSR